METIMSPRLAIKKLQLRLNKLDSLDYDNISLPIAVEAINKAAIEWVRRQVHGNNPSREGDEKSKFRIDDLQFLIKSKTLKGSNHRLYFESELFPKDYLYLKSIIPYMSKEECTMKTFDISLVEESNATTYLSDNDFQPSFEWQQSFYTLVGNKIRLYINNDFKVNNIILQYYRLPYKMDIEGYEHVDESTSKNIDLEFKDDIAELIIDAAAAIIAGDIESSSQVQINSQREQNNN